MNNQQSEVPVEVRSATEVDAMEKQNQFAEASNNFRDECFLVIVTNDAEYQAGAELLKSAANKVKAVLEFMDPDIKRAHEMHKALTTKRNSITEPLAEAKEHIGKQMAKYDDEIEVKQKAEAALLAKQERERQELSDKKEKERRDEEAKSHENAGDSKTAQMIRNAPVERPAFHAPISTIKKPVAKGISFKTRWEVEVICQDLVPEKYKTINQGLLNSQANAFKGDIKIPGCVIRKEKSTNTRTR